MERSTSDPGIPTRTSAPLFILSFRQRDELAAMAANAGWQVVAARRSAGAERRFSTSGAQVAVLDARGAFEDGLIGARELTDAVARQGGALLALVSKGDIGRIGEVYAAGATHFLASPFVEAEFVQALRFAARHAERVGGEIPVGARNAEPLGWRYDPRRNTLQLTPALARLADLNDSPSPRAALRRLDPVDRRTALLALKRLGEGRGATAFAHDLGVAGRVVEHVQLDPESGQVHGLVEALGGQPDSVAVVREALTGARDAEGARRWLQRKIDQGRPVAVLLGALARVEVVNTSYGRAAGDSLLRTASRRVSDAAHGALGSKAIVARMGGAEFLVAAEADDDAVAKAVSAIGDALARPFAVEDRIVPVGARIASIRSAGERIDDLLRRASESLAGSADGSGGESALPIDRLAGDLRGALERGEIEMMFQPQVGIADGVISGVEALARWRHPELGEVGAEPLFAAAQHAGLVAALSDHAQRMALASAARWPKSLAPLLLAINVTAEDIARSSFADILPERVDSSGFPRSRLTIEITESGLIDDLARAATLFAELRAAGLRVAIDDFGTGYSSLAYLKALPLDYLKIDKKLSQDVTGTARDRVVVRGVIDMARSLGLSVVAEGVETAEQLDLLAREGCQYYQGFLCAEALSSEALALLVEKAA
ncbi:EAL domain-containing protein [soil metagenome]